ncbi:WW domain-binding protein 2-like isoform X1 [Stegostoma tigrinum]|uniref:WW domain-binding protein 2-like isoform X1 n=2 Tax=Stegostoma tigrinum TaxID=3053191 RepID=UPI0028709B46|nr:WW domain-binding protein 2-like isoform X1 [Stegostoma tigrinum]
MAINKPGQPGHQSFLMFYDYVELSVKNKSATLEIFNSSRKGTLYLLPHQVLFLSKDLKQALKSFTMPLSLMKDCKIKQPKFRPGYIKGHIEAAPNGGWVGSATFKLTFHNGGANEFGQLMLQLQADEFKKHGLVSDQTQKHDSISAAEVQNRDSVSPDDH